MMQIQAGIMNFKDLNAAVADSCDTDITIDQCFGQRYIGCGSSGKHIKINGTPGNALGAYLNGTVIDVIGNAQDAMGDTMNEGTIYVHGNSGDATGYAMRGGKIFVKGSAGYRAGIHMKAYQTKLPVLVVGEATGSFLGEYQAGGVIVVLGIGKNGEPPIGNFVGTGMHGGKIFLRCDKAPARLPHSVLCAEATDTDKAEIRPYVQEFCDAFGGSPEELLAGRFFVLSPDTQNPYKDVFTPN